jgi:hypothetical protein
MCRIPGLPGQFLLRGGNQKQRQAALDVSQGESQQVQSCEEDDFIFAQGVRRALALPRAQCQQATLVGRLAF